jgi:hypothetical protein
LVIGLRIGYWVIGLSGFDRAIDRVIDRAIGVIEAIESLGARRQRATRHHDRVTPEAQSPDGPIGRSRDGPISRSPDGPISDQ